MNAQLNSNTSWLLREIVEMVREFSDTFRTRTLNLQDAVLSIAHDIYLEMILSDVVNSPINTNVLLLTVQLLSHGCEFFPSFHIMKASF